MGEAILNYPFNIEQYYHRGIKCWKYKLHHLYSQQLFLNAAHLSVCTLRFYGSTVLYFENIGPTATSFSLIVEIILIIYNGMGKEIQIFEFTSFFVADSFEGMFSCVREVVTYSLFQVLRFCLEHYKSRSPAPWPWLLDTKVNVKIGQK